MIELFFTKRTCLLKTNGLEIISLSILKIDFVLPVAISTINNRPLLVESKISFCPIIKPIG